MMAMAASIAAVYPHMNHIGGDGFFLVRERSGRVRALMGAGRAGANASQSFYREHGCDTIPARGPLAALTVPGAVAAWMLAHEAAIAQGGRLPLALLLEAAINRARDGFAVTAARPGSRRSILPGLPACRALRRHFWSTASRPRSACRAGRALAATLAHLGTPDLTIFIAAMSAARSPPI